MERLTRKNKYNQWVTPFCTRYYDEELKENYTGHSVSRLAEYEDREEKGCGWCNKGYRFEFNWINDDGSTITTNDNMVISDIADFCPMCGKKLTNK